MMLVNKVILKHSNQTVKGSLVSIEGCQDEFREVLMNSFFFLILLWLFETGFL